MGTWERDSPWQRLFWTLPAALAVWITVLWVFAFFMENPTERLPEPPAIEAQLVEISVPAVTTSSPETRPTSPVKPFVPAKLPQNVAPQPRSERTLLPMREEKSAAQPSAAPALPKPSESSAREEPSASNTNLTATGGAQAIVRPMPQIPDELRQEALSVAAVARFRVTADGTATVELVKPTPSPRLNRLLLDTLKNWRFFPAMKDGKPVASIEEIVIKLEVK